MQRVEASCEREPRPFSGRIVRSASWPGVRCHEAAYEARFRESPHEHAEPFFALLLSGACDEVAARRLCEIVSGAAIFRPAQEEHALVVRDAPARAFVAEVESNVLEERFGCAIPRHANADGVAAALLVEMYREFRVGDSAAGLAIHGLLLQLAANLSRAVDTSAPRARFVDRVDEYLRLHFDATLTLEEIAREVGAPPARLSAAFRASRGHSIADELRRLRVEQACKRMIESSRPLAEIAVECGFADQPHFSRAFRRVKGMTPARYRELVR